MAFLHPAVSRRKFDALVHELIRYTETQQPLWTVVAWGYPFIGVHVLNVRREPKFALRVDVSEWPHRPFSVQPMTLDFHAFIPEAQIPKTEAVVGGRHIYSDQRRGITWFCTQGTMEFHENYAEDIPWEAVRSNANMRPEMIVIRCLELVDVNKM